MKQHALDDLFTELDPRALARARHHRDIGVACMHRGNAAKIARKRFGGAKLGIRPRSFQTRLDLLALNLCLLACSAEQLGPHAGDNGRLVRQRFIRQRRQKGGGEVTIAALLR
jgi:hypothetical protein